MIDLFAEEGPCERFALHSTDATRRGDGPEATAAAIELTQPMVTPLTDTLAAADPELAAFWTAEQGRYRYDYVTFRASFIPDAQGFERAQLAVGLSPAGGQTGSIAWSIAPLLVTDESKLKDVAKVGLDLKLLKLELGQEEETSGQSWFLRGWKEHTATPYWELRRTEAAEIEGSFRFHLVVRSAASIAAKGVLSARATIAGRSFWIFRGAATETQADIRFHLPPHTA